VCAEGVGVCAEGGFYCRSGLNWVVNPAWGRMGEPYKYARITPCILNVVSCKLERPVRKVRVNLCRPFGDKPGS
jgi:hypothetical protein